MQYICIWLPICQAGSHCVHYLADGLGISVRSPSLQMGCFSVPPVVLTVGEALPPIRGETAIAVFVMGRVKERTSSRLPATGNQCRHGQRNAATSSPVPICFTLYFGPNVCEVLR